MNQIDIVKKICGILMAGGTAVLLFMISDLVHKACVIGASALDAAIHNREKKDKRLLLYTGISNGIYGLHGMILPVAAAAAASVIFIRMNPVKTSVIPVLLIYLWGTAAACRLNIRYSIMYLPQEYGQKDIAKYGAVLNYLTRFVYEAKQSSLDFKSLLSSLETNETGAFKARTTRQLTGRGYSVGLIADPFFVFLIIADTDAVLFRDNDSVIEYYAKVTSVF